MKNAFEIRNHLDKARGHGILVAVIVLLSFLIIWVRCYIGHSQQASTAATTTTTITYFLLFRVCAWQRDLGRNP